MSEGDGRRPVLGSRTPYRRLIFLLFGLFILWGFGRETVWSRLMLDLHGVVISSIDEPSTRPPRYETTYTVHSDDGRNTKYVAWPTDASLERSMPVGSRVDKSRWQLDYTVNGQRFSFPLPFYAAAILIGLGAVSIGLSGLLALWRSLRRSGRM